ncbi:DUF4123 domain-containing protein [Providencia stuartii]|uniref:DUF4123 domain-containing protein n=1 Tax=Providencia stuartii TaxID=588 RepID=UPI0024B227A8
MPLTLQSQQQYWVMEYYKDKDGISARGKILVCAENELYAAEVFRLYFMNQGFSSFYYESLISLQGYLAQSQQSEWLCIQALNTIAEQSALIFEEREITYPLAIEQACLTIRSIESLRSELAEERVYILVDAARYHVCSEQFILPVLYSLNCPWGCLLQGESGAALEDSAPYLIEIPSAPERSLTQQQFLTFCCENAVGILLQSSLSFADLSHHFRKFTYMPIANGTAWYFFRFYDPDIFYLLVSHLSTVEIKHFLRNITGCYFLSDGRPYVLSYYPEQNDVAAARPLRITPYLQQVFQHYQQALLIKKIDENFPEPVGSHKVTSSTVERKTQITQTLNQAYLLGLTHPKALYYFLVAQINFPDEHWLSRWKIAKAYSSSQEVSSLHYLELTINAVS